MISQTKLDELEALAEEATPNEWIVYREPHLVNEIQITTVTRKMHGKTGIAEIPQAHLDYNGRFLHEQKANAKYIAAANPAMVLEMIAEIKSLRQENERLNAEADWLANNVEFGCPDEVDPEAWWYEICKHDDCKGQKEDVGACWRRAAQRWLTMQKEAQALPSRVTAKDDGK